MRKHLVIGILAHVDAGKTTLSEALLFKSGVIRNLGRVDSKNAFLDNNSIERERGITIFSKQAVLNDQITLVDTPGHIDFGAEMERALSVLDSAILVINASDGVQSHTKTLWSLLNQHKIPTVIFVNKMDINGTDKSEILKNLHDSFGDSVIDFANQDSGFYENVASCDEILLEKFLSENHLCDEDIKSVVAERKIFPCIFGSALKLEGIENLLKVLENFCPESKPSEDFGCVVYKVAKDGQGSRLSFLKVTGGVLRVKENLGEEKINEIRIYSGEKYESVKEVEAGQICAVVGPKSTVSGMIFGNAKTVVTKKMEPALIYSIVPSKEIDSTSMLKILRELEEEMPELKIDVSDLDSQIQIMLMGEVQTQVLKQILQDRFSINIEFGDGRIAYKESIAESVVGVGHYEPLKHYAEAHLKLSPRPRGSGMKFVSNLSVDELDTNWQRLIMTHLQEKVHVGVLTGSPLTDIEIEIVAGRAHLKHTEGGDFRQATYRAIRHGLMKSKSVLLEPVYRYEIIVPENCTGRIMSDFERMHGTCSLDENKSGFATLSGKVPVSSVKNYVAEVRSFTKGLGSLSLTVDGYEECHNTDEVISQINYNPDADLKNPASSVFCSHGAGFVVDWKDVDAYKHIK